MSTVLKHEIHSTSSENTVRLGEVIGSALKGGEVIELKSDLGGGKTTLTKGIVKGAGSADTVGSPTFTISKEYTAPTFTIKHFDFYRLTEPGIVANELQEDIHNSHDVVLIEWGDIVADVLPKQTIVIELFPSSDTARSILLTIPEKYMYIKQAIDDDFSN